MLFLFLMSFGNFIDWFESGGFFLVIGIPLALIAVAAGAYEAGRRSR